MYLYNIIKYTTLATLLFVSSYALSQDRPGSGPNPYSDCGIGAALFPKTHWAAVTSNVTWDLGTTAVTSATVSPETCSEKNVETAQYIIDNYDNLIEETAKGEGSYLSALLAFQSCNHAEHEDAIIAIRTNMIGHLKSNAYGDLDQLTKASDYYDTVTSVASSRCSS